MAIDGNVSTKWVSNKSDQLCLHDSGSNLGLEVSYRVFTADDSIGSDPLQWHITSQRLFSGNDNFGSAGDLSVVHNQSADNHTPLQRGAPTGWFTLSHQDLNYYKPG